MSFAEDFRRHVIPELREMLRKRGLFLALDMVGFDEACSEVMLEARKRGAKHLDDDAITELDDWIACTLLEQCKKFEPAVAQSAEVADRVAADIRRWEAKCLLAQGSTTKSNSSSNPPDSQIPPPYPHVNGFTEAN